MIDGLTHLFSREILMTNFDQLLVLCLGNLSSGMIHFLGYRTKFSITFKIDEIRIFLRERIVARKMKDD